MTKSELILGILAEVSTKDISQAINPKNFAESKTIAQQGGNVANGALKEMEAKSGIKVDTALTDVSVPGLYDTNKKVRNSQIKILLPYL